MYSNAQNRMRMRIYNCFNDIRVTIPSLFSQQPALPSRLTGCFQTRMFLVHKVPLVLNVVH